MDGNFGLKRMSMAKNSINADYFLLNDHIGKFEMLHDTIKTHGVNVCLALLKGLPFCAHYNNKFQDCDDSWKAGNEARNSGASEKIGSKGVFGSACRHGVPLYFIDFNGGGEKLIYALTIVDKLHHDHKVDLHILYDIACKLKPYVEVIDYLRQVRVVRQIRNLKAHKIPIVLGKSSFRGIQELEVRCGRIPCICA